MQDILTEIKIFLDNNIVNPTGIYIIIIYVNYKIKIVPQQLNSQVRLYLRLL